MKNTPLPAFDLPQCLHCFCCFLVLFLPCFAAACCKPPGFHKHEGENKHIGGLDRPKHHQNSTIKPPERGRKTREDTRREKKRMKWRWEKEKKNAKFWAPHPPSLPPFGAPIFLGLGPPPFGSSTFRGPTLRDTGLRGPSAGPPSAGQLGCCLCCFAPDSVAFPVAASAPTVELPPPPLLCLTFQNVDNNFSQLIGGLCTRGPTPLGLNFSVFCTPHSGLFAAVVM